MNARDLRAGLCAVWEKEWQGRPGAPLLEVYDTIGSTNDRAAELARSGAPDGSLVAADRQIRGRGRRGRVWETPPGAAVAMSVISRIGAAPEAASPAPLAAALAVRRAIRQLSGKELLLKWPNDLYADGRKCCGILSELIRLSAGDWAIVTGIGINLTPQAYGSALAGTAVSLEEAGIAAGRCALIAAIRRSFCEMIGTIVSQGGTLGSLQQEYTENLLWLGREVSLRDAAGQGPEGVLRGISPRGELLLETAEGLQSFLAGELSLRPRTEEKVFDP